MISRYGHLLRPQRDLLAHAQRVGASLTSVTEQGRPGRVNRRLIGALAERGLLGRLFGDVDNDSAERRISALDLCLMREGLALECTEAETALALQGLGSHPLLIAGRAEVMRWIDGVVNGEAVPAFALTEPEAGSDVASLSLRAERARDGWLLSGTKTLISNAPDADFYTIFARTSGDRGVRGITAFAVRGGSDGIEGERLELLTPHAIGRLRLDRVHVPDEQVLGEVDRGFGIAMATLNLFRPSVGAFAVGMGQAAIDAAIQYTSERKAFRRPLRDFQAVSHRLADAATRVHAARLLVHDAASATEHGREDVRALVAMAKLFATEVAQEAVDVALQVHGGRALERGHLIEHLYREVRAPRIYEGASEVQRESIARALYG